MKVVLLSEGAKAPKRANNFAAGYDLFAPRDVEIKTGRNLVHLDISVELNPQTEGMVRPRSGFSVKGIEGVYASNLNTPKRFNADVIIGTIDEDFRGNVGVIIKSYEERPFIIKQGTKIAQMVINKYESSPFKVVDSLSETERGKNGIGSTGTM